MAKGLKFIQITYDNGCGYCQWNGYYRNKAEARRDFRKNYPCAEIIEVEVIAE